MGGRNLASLNNGRNRFVERANYAWHNRPKSLAAGQDRWEKLQAQDEKICRVPNDLKEKAVWPEKNVDL